jgi:hypothetical protein
VEREFSDRPTLLLGRDHTTYGEYECVVLPGGRTAVAMSVGADPSSPALLNKGHAGFPNEDALLAIDRGEKTLLAVADAHFGWHASHDLLLGIAEAATIPAGPQDLEEMIAGLEPRSDRDGSSSTLVVGIHDRKAQQGFGVSYGDSTLAVVGPKGASTLSLRGAHYVDPHDSDSLAPWEGYAFRFFTQPGHLILVFTDGINECHYGSPPTSVTPEHWARLFSDVGPDPEAYARKLMGMALAGVGGNPGGQDNVALIVSAT